LNQTRLVTWRWWARGRVHELAALESLYRTVVDEGLPRLVLLLGQAGVGKSRFIDQFVRHMPLSPPPVVYRGRCLAYGEGITYWALREILWAATGIAFDDPAAEAAAKLNARVGHVLEAAEAERVSAALAMASGISLLENPLERVSPGSVADEVALAWPADQQHAVHRQRLPHRPLLRGGPVDFLTFPANRSNTGGDSCRYMSSDSSGDTTTETLQQSMTLSSRTPICTDVSASTTENKPVTVQLACTNPSNSQLNYFLATQPHHAANWSFEGGRITYTPAPGFTGTDTFTYSAEPLNGLPGNTATATITVTPPTGPSKPPKPPGHAKKHKHRKEHKRHKGKRRAVVCKVPTVKGRTLLGAKLSLRRAHCGVGQVTRRKSSTVAKGRVVASSPRAATRHRAGTKVKLTVSLGH